MTLISRSDWGARNPKQWRTNYAAKTVEFHHTVTPGFDYFAQNGGKATIRNVQNTHMDSNGWNDIFYTRFVMPNGDVYEGREVSSSGVLTVCFVGNFETSEPTADQLAVMKAYVDEFGADSVTWHRKRALGTKYASLCPGENMIEAIQAAMAAPPATPGESTVTTSYSQVDAEALVTVSYKGILNRGPDAAGLAFWSSELVEGNRSITDIRWEFLVVRLAADDARIKALAEKVANPRGTDPVVVSNQAFEQFLNDLSAFVSEQAG